jgi:hypothetical protein
MHRHHAGPAALAVLALVLTGGPASADVTIAPENITVNFVRADYLARWADEDGDKMSTRQEVLEAESRDPVTITERYGRRIVTQGEWFGPYTGFKTTQPAKMAIDHLVPLKEAHESGAWAWSAEKKRRYANDLSNPAHLIAVGANAVKSKDDKDPADWLPPNRAYWCQYIKDWVEVKRRWGLTMDAREAKAVSKGAKVCKQYASGDHLDGRH